MKKNITLLAAALVAFFAFPSQISAQVSATITGPTSLCVGECATYTVSVDSFDIAFVNWSDAAGQTLPSNGETVFYCPPFTGPGTVVLFASGLTVGQYDFFAEIAINVSFGSTPVIVPTVASCPQDSSGATSCEKICAFGTATYEVVGVSPGTPVIWLVQGAENFTPNGNTVEVEWGAPGQGEVSVVTGGGSAGSPFQLFCGQQAVINPNSPPTSIYLSFFGGVPPYSLLTSINGVAQPAQAITTNSYTYFSTQIGLFDFTAVDATGQTVGCSTFISASQQDCWVSASPTQIVHPTSDFNCDGFVALNGVGGVPPYTYFWSNGVNTSNVDGLCCGNYTVTVMDASGCTATATIVMACPQQNSCGGEASLCVEILEEPEAQISSLPPPNNGTITVCQGQTVFFENESTNATTYVWEFGNGNTSTQFEPSQTYGSPGTYTVSLIARNECFCADTAFVNVEVIPADVPEINCTGTICEGETVTYSTDSQCGMYNWTVTGSYNILDGGGTADNFITVEWTAGPEGTIALNVSGCNGSVCNLPNTVPIPIVSDNAEIQGPDKVCEGSTEEYFIPNYQGTNINWTVLGSGTITNGQGSERITVNWFGSANQGNPQRVVVEFDNCYLGCSGKDTLNVNIVPGFYTTGPIEVCQNSSGSYQSRNAVNNSLMMANWELRNNAGTVVWSSPAAANTANIPFNLAPGSYTVHAEAASASSFCNDFYNLFIKIVAAPPAPTAIAGEDEICAGLTYAYEATGLPGADFTWNFVGSSGANFSGNPANATWAAAPPYTVSVVQTTTTGLACTSPPTLLTVNPIPSFSITGGGQICREETGVYTVPFFENIDYQWIITPSSAGTIVSGHGSEEVGVLWHTAGAASVSVTVCGTVQTFNVNVLPLPEPVAQAPAQLCAGETALVQTAVGYAGYIWRDADGATISVLANPDFGPGNYEVEVTDVNGCAGDTIFEIGSIPAPNISISTPAYFALCNGGPGATLHATESNPPFSYQWQQNGVDVGTDAPTFSTNQPGSYRVVATAVNGCSAISNTLTLVDCAAAGGICSGGLCFGLGGGPPASSCTPNGTVDFTTASTATCNAVAFTNTSTNFVPGSFTWFFDDGTTSTLDNPPPHTYATAGYYTAVLVGEVAAIPSGSCGVGIYHDLLVPVEPNFTYSSACPGLPVQFNDQSVFISPESITAWAWDFADPASGMANTSNLEDPTHVFGSPGTYNVSLTVTAASGCTATATLPVTVFMPPAVSFALPSATCENTSLPFNATVGSGVASVYWDFGDPASGDSDESELLNSFHEYGLPGTYTVQLTALSIEGCTNVFSDDITITPNTLGGTIGFSQPSPICEGESITLTAPPGGSIWEWSNNGSADNITVSESGVYVVTLTDATGCSYMPGPAIVDVLGEPNGIIKAVEYNEFGQPVAFFENSHTVCEGEDVFIVVQGSTSNSYTWSNGQTETELEFSEDKGNLLPVGTHVFTVTVTDGNTGCTATEGPFTVTVNPVPLVAIASNPSGFICENNNATLSVVAPNPALTYNWNTGETGTSISVIAGGTYFATAVNQFGCRGQSNEIEVQNAPDIDLVPQGCFTRCQPDTMCLPDVPTVANYQWFFNGNPLPGPNGTQANPIFTLSGEYWVQMTDIFGCTSTSPPLNLDLFTGYGTISGNVYFDVNENGIIDGPDTLVSGVQVILNNGTANVDTVVSSVASGYNFVDILSTGYTLLLDTLNLPTGWAAVVASTDLTLVGCDVAEQYDWLVYEACSPSATAVQLSACPNGTADFNGTPVPVNTSQDFLLTSTEGCDSVVTVTVVELATSVGAEAFDACLGTSVTYNGLPVLAGTSEDFILTNWLGCDSVVTVTVNALPAPNSTETLTACPGGFATYNGQQLAAGTTTNFLYPSSQNCDSVVIVTVAELATSASTVNLSACFGSSAAYNGVDIAAGATQQFTLTNWLGCDSTVTVAVESLPVTVQFVDAVACANSFFEYNGQQLLPGTQTTFTTVNQWGCTDTTFVAVFGLPTATSSLSLNACPGSTVTYAGVPLSAGDVQDFTLTNWYGCDSVVTVSVAAVQADTVQLSLQVCDGETLDYNGEQLSAGETFNWVGTNQAGCDSLVVVSVAALPSVSYQLVAPQICWNAADGSISVTGINGSSGPYLYSMDGAVFQSEPLFEGLPPGDYAVFVQDQNGCVFEENTSIAAVQPIVVEASDKTLACGSDVLLNPLVISDLPIEWEWRDSTGVVSTAAEIYVAATGTYTFSATNDCETATGQVAVTAEPLSETKLVYIPNSFSPNGDGINDCFRGFLAPNVVVLKYELDIFDRWGTRLYGTRDPESCWDGFFKGKSLNPGTLVYWLRLRVKHCDGEEVEVFWKGDLNLLR